MAVFRVFLVCFFPHPQWSWRFKGNFYRFHFSVRHWLSLLPHFFMVDDKFGDDLLMIFFLDWNETLRQHMHLQEIVSILIFVLPVSLDRFCRNVILIYLLSIKTWLFLSNKFVSHAKKYSFWGYLHYYSTSIFFLKRGFFQVWNSR